MSTRQKRSSCFQRKIVVRLWAMMMFLVAIAILFMWVAQIFLFERNYMDSAIAELQGYLDPLMEDIETADLADNTALTQYLSKSINGKMILLSTDGTFLAAYSIGHPLEMQAKELSYLWDIVQKSDGFGSLLRGGAYTHVLRYESKSLTYELGIPVTYGGAPAYAFLYHSKDEVFTVLDINRNQLTVLSILLTALAAALAAVLSRLFVKPIFQLKNTADHPNPSPGAENTISPGAGSSLKPIQYLPMSISGSEIQTNRHVLCSPS